MSNHYHGCAGYNYRGDNNICVFGTGQYSGRLSFAPSPAVALSPLTWYLLQVDWLFEHLAAPTLDKPLQKERPLISEIQRGLTDIITATKITLGLAVPKSRPINMKRRKHAVLYAAEDGTVMVPDTVRLTHYRAVKMTQSLLQRKLQAWRSRRTASDIEGGWNSSTRRTQLRLYSAAVVAVAPLTAPDGQLEKMPSLFDKFMRDFSDQRISLSNAERSDFDARWGYEPS